MTETAKQLGTGVEKVFADFETPVPDEKENSTFTREITDVLFVDKYVEKEEKGVKYLVDKKGSKCWSSIPSRVGQRLIPGQVRIDAPVVAWYDLSKEEDRDAYNTLLKGTVPLESPSVEIIKEQGTFHEKSYLCVVMYTRVWYLTTELR